MIPERNHSDVVYRLESPLGVPLGIVPLASAGDHGHQTTAMGGKKLCGGGTLAPIAFFQCPQLSGSWAPRSGRAEVGHRLDLLDDRCLLSGTRFSFVNSNGFQRSLKFSLQVINVPFHSQD